MSKVNTKTLSPAYSGPVSFAAAEAQPVYAVCGGRVKHDSRGNAIWDWAVATGVLAGKKSAELLRMLDDPALQIEGDGQLAGEWAGDPYNRR